MTTIISIIQDGQNHLISDRQETCSTGLKVDTGKVTRLNHYAALATSGCMWFGQIAHNLIAPDIKKKLPYTAEDLTAEFALRYIAPIIKKHVEEQGETAKESAGESSLWLVTSRLNITFNPKPSEFFMSLRGDTWAIGSGAYFARGAIQALANQGKDEPRELLARAIKVCDQLDAFTGSEWDLITLG